MLSMRLYPQCPPLKHHTTQHLAPNLSSFREANFLQGLFQWEYLSHHRLRDKSRQDRLPAHKLSLLHLLQRHHLRLHPSIVSTVPPLAQHPPRTSRPNPSSFHCHRPEPVPGATAAQRYARTLPLGQTKTRRPRTPRLWTLSRRHRSDARTSLGLPTPLRRCHQAWSTRRLRLVL